MAEQKPEAAAPRPPAFAPPWFYGWNIVVIGILSQVLVSGMALTSFSLWVPAWMTEYHAQRAPIIGAMTLTLLIAGLSAPLIGQLFDRWPSRRLFSIGLGLFALGFFLIANSKVLWEVVWGYGLCMGSATTLSGSVATQALTSRWFRKRLGLALGLAMTGFSVGGITMPPLLAWLLTAFGWRQAALIIGCLGLALIPFVLLIVRNRPEDMGLEPEVGSSYPQPSRTWTARQVLTNRNFWPLVLAFTPVFIALKGMAANFGPLASDLGVPVSIAAVIIAANNACTIPTKVLLGRLADIADPRLVLVALNILVGIGLLLMMGHASLTRLIIGNIVLGLGSAGAYPMQGILIRRYFGVTSFGRVIGLLNMFFLVSGFAGQWAGFSRDHSGAYDHFLLLAGIAPIFGGLFVLRMRTSAQTEAANADR